MGRPIRVHVPNTLYQCRQRYKDAIYRNYVFKQIKVETDTIGRPIEMQVFVIEKTQIWSFNQSKFIFVCYF